MRVRIASASAASRSVSAMLYTERVLVGCDFSREPLSQPPAASSSAMASPHRGKRSPPTDVSGCTAGLAHRTGWLREPGQARSCWSLGRLPRQTGSGARPGERLCGAALYPLLGRGVAGMFEVGRAYRVFVRRGDTHLEIDGTLLQARGDLLMFDVEGVQTIFHLGGGSVAYIEVADAQAQEARAQTRAARLVSIAIDGRPSGEDAMVANEK